MSNSSSDGSTGAFGTAARGKLIATLMDSPREGETAEETVEVTEHPAPPGNPVEKKIYFDVQTTRPFKPVQSGAKKRPVQQATSCTGRGPFRGRATAKKSPEKQQKAVADLMCTAADVLARTMRSDVHATASGSHVAIPSKSAGGQVKSAGSPVKSVAAASPNVMNMQASPIRYSPPVYRPSDQVRAARMSSAKREERMVKQRKAPTPTFPKTPDGRRVFLYGGEGGSKSSDDPTDPRDPSGHGGKNPVSNADPAPGSLHVHHHAAFSKDHESPGTSKDHEQTSSQSPARSSSRGSTTKELLTI